MKEKTLAIILVLIIALGTTSLFTIDKLKKEKVKEIISQKDETVLQLENMAKENQALAVQAKEIVDKIDDVKEKSLDKYEEVQEAIDELEQERLEQQIANMEKSTTTITTTTTTETAQLETTTTWIYLYEDDEYEEEDD